MLTTVRKKIARSLAVNAEATRRYMNEVREVRRMANGESREFSVLLYLSPMVRSDADRLINRVRTMNPQIPAGHEVRFAVPNPRPGRICVMYCEVKCATAAQALQVVVSTLSAALTDEGLTVDDIQVEVDRLPGNADD